MFPGAAADRESADYALVGAPLDRSTSFRPGTRFGPRRIRHHAGGFEDFDHRTGAKFTDRSVYDHGDVGPTADAAEYLDFLTGTLSDLREEGATPLLVGGEHTVTVASVRAVDPDVYVCLDAHLDLRESYAGDPLSHATVTRHALAVADRAVLLGARAGSEAEWERAAEADVTVVPPEDVAEWSPDLPGTGTPEPFGIAPSEGRRLVSAVASACEGFDVVEVNDRDDGQAATLAAKLLRRFVHDHAAEG
ncbi:agmatinase [Halobacteriales archaeon QH_3_68_24]|nr:MAG: agmatinase [Halobacteriales archaeon QH_3_68_24]